MGYSYMADLYLLWTSEYVLDIAHKKLAGQLFLVCSDYGLADHYVH